MAKRTKKIDKKKLVLRSFIRDIWNEELTRPSLSGWKLRLLYKNLPSMDGSASFCTATKTATITIDIACLKKESTARNQEVLLHELGHIISWSRKKWELYEDTLQINDYYYSPRAEAAAQLYAIRKAKKLGIKSAHKAAKKTVKDWLKFDPYSPYYKASKIILGCR